MRIRRLFGALLAGVLLAAPAAEAQQYEQVGDVQIHYNALNTTFLAPEMARAAGIQRSPGLGLLNVSVLESRQDGTSRAVNARVDGRVGILGGEGRPLDFRTVRDGGGISHIATFRIREGEPMQFTLVVTPDPDRPPTEIGFIQRFYIDR
ncbi:DUF4426 domain-containing protein [Halomonas organivorans]|uniref:DUF4426 domain-containing protein n=1 Tax=Halomonas organivorans TaxID=257772 RepID=A0A7W5C0A8_9GAMM|nr:DUF4426 domain-containing protein [Halomonas organivorans]MBB3142480.1 hypothetical protein [Halomonas organivorans]